MDLFNRLRLTKSKSPPTRAPSKAAHRALQLPEVLELIFYFLSPATLRTKVVLVCRQWNEVARIFPIQILHWTLQTNSTEQEEQEARKILARTKTLICCQWWNTEMVAPDPNYLDRWPLLTLAVEKLSSKKPLLIQELWIPYARNTTVQTLPVLRMLPTLTTLRLERVKAPETILLGDILALCPNLLHLTLESVRRTPTMYRGDIVANEPAKLTLSEKHPVPSCLKLETLELHSMAIEPMVLEALLLACHDVQRLRLAFIEQLRLPGVPTPRDRADHRFVPMDWLRLLNRIEVVCPKLTSFHLSQPNNGFWNDPGVRKLLRWFPLLTEVGALDEILQPAMLRGLTTSFDMLTTLVVENRMRNSFVQASVVNFAEVLHQYLCGARHLLHLRAGEILFWISELDVGQITNECGDYRGLGLSPARSEPTRIWACRKLRTLHLAFGRNGHDSGSEMNTRLTFDYVSRVCPDLEDISIRRRSMRLSLLGGLCLLTRLKKLRKLRLKTGRLGKMALLDQDLDWMAQERTVLSFMERRRRSIWIQHLGHLEAEKLEKSKAAQRQLLLWEKNDCGVGRLVVDGVDLTTLGWHTEVLDMAKESLKKQRSPWPVLESIEFVYDGMEQSQAGERRSFSRRLLESVGYEYESLEETPEGKAALALKGLLKKHRPGVDLIWAKTME